MAAAAHCRATWLIVLHDRCRTPIQPRGAFGSAGLTRAHEARKTCLPVGAVARAELLPRGWRARHRPTLIQERIARHITPAGACAADGSTRLRSLTGRRAPTRAALDVAARMVGGAANIAGLATGARDRTACSAGRAVDRAVPTTGTGDRAAAVAIDRAGSGRGIARGADRRTRECIGLPRVGGSHDAVASTTDPTAVALRGRRAREVVGFSIDRATPKQRPCDDQADERSHGYHCPRSVKVAPAPCSAGTGVTVAVSWLLWFFHR